MLKNLRKAEILFAFALFAFAVRFPPIDELSDTNLTFHMTVQHLITFIPGLILGAQLVKLATPNKPVSIFFTVVAVVLMALWHLPSYWDLALLNDFIHILMHLSFFIAGVLVSFSLPALGSPLRWSLLIAYFIFSSILAAYVTGGRQLYQSSPPAQHIQLAIFMVYTMPVMFLVLAFTPYYIPKFTDFWTGRKLSIYFSGLLILVFLGYLILFKGTMGWN